MFIGVLKIFQSLTHRIAKGSPPSASLLFPHSHTRSRYHHGTHLSPTHRNSTATLAKASRVLDTPERMEPPEVAQEEADSTSSRERRTAPATRRSRPRGDDPSPQQRHASTTRESHTRFASRGDISLLVFITRVRVILCPPRLVREKGG